MKTNILFLLVAILFSSTMKAQDSTLIKANINKAKIYYNQGVLLMKDSKYADAVAYFDSSLSLDKVPQTYYYKGFAFFNLKNYDEAKANYRSAIALNDSFDNAYIKLAYLHLNLKEYDDANANFEKILKISKNEQTRTDAEMQIEVIKDQRSTEEINKGVECAKSGKFEDAIKCYESALKFKRDYRPYYYQAAAYRGLKKVPEAVNAYQQSLAISEKPEVYKGLAGLYLEQKDFEKAIANYEKAAAKEEAGRVYVSWGIALFKEKAFDKAIEKLTIANQSNETDLNYYFIAQAFGEKKKYADADTAFNKVLTLQKTITPGQVAYSRGVMYKAKGDMNKAIEQFKLGLSDEKVKKACKSEIDYYEAKLKNEKKK